MRPLAFDELIVPQTGRMRPRKVNVNGETYECARCSATWWAWGIRLRNKQAEKGFLCVTSIPRRVPLTLAKTLIRKRRIILARALLTGRESRRLVRRLLRQPGS